MPYNDPDINLGTFDVAGAFLDGGLGEALLNGLGNHWQNRLESSHWWWMASAIRIAETKGLSATVGETTIRTFLMAGRLLTTLSRDEHQVSFLGYEHEDDDWWGGAVQSIEAPLSVALAMIEDVTDVMHGYRLAEDADVTIGA